jgi:hypothetical protein
MSHQLVPTSAGSSRMPRRCSGATVGDSPRGPLNNRGKPPNFAMNAKRKLIYEAKTHTRHDHDPSGPHGPPKR